MEELVCRINSNWFMHTAEWGPSFDHWHLVKVVLSPTLLQCVFLQCPCQCGQVHFCWNRSILAARSIASDFSLHSRGDCNINTAMLSMQNVHRSWWARLVADKGGGQNISCMGLHLEPVYVKKWCRGRKLLLLFLHILYNFVRTKQKVSLFGLEIWLQPLLPSYLFSWDWIYQPALRMSNYL